LKRARQHKSWFLVGSAGIAGLLGLVLVGACGQTVEVGLDDASLTGAGGLAGVGAGGSAGVGGGLQLGGSGIAGTGNEAGAPGCVITTCRGQVYECGDCMDNADGDGLIDSLDPDCFGPCDNDESGLGTGLSTSQAAACRQDCYFDGNNGAGNDKCEWSHACDPLSLPPDYPPSREARCRYTGGGITMGVDCEGLKTSQEPACVEACKPLVPNGCDCFGCCELQRGSGQYRYIGKGGGEQGCQRDKLDDFVSCPPCTPVGSCFNSCERCETCVSGVTSDPTCEPEAACPAGQKICGPDNTCGFGDYCVTGCCVPPPAPPR
jgi:hypothetical protein